MSNFSQIHYCEKCNQMTTHTFHDARSVDGIVGPKGQSYKIICQKCGYSRWEEVENDN